MSREDAAKGIPKAIAHVFVKTKMASTPIPRTRYRETTARIGSFF
jgi:hypothetical protein